MTHVVRQHDHATTRHSALSARFAGLGIATLAAYALVTATPTSAWAQEVDEPLDGLQGIEAPEVLEATEQEPQVDAQEPQVDAQEQGEQTAAQEPGETEPAQAVATASDQQEAAGQDDSAEQVAEDAAPDEVQAEAQAQAETQPAPETQPTPEAPAAATATAEAPAQQPVADPEPAAAPAQEAAEETVEFAAATTATERKALAKAAADTTDDKDGEPELRQGWDSTHTHYYVDDVMQKGVTPITNSKGVTHYYLFDKNGKLVKADHRKIDGRIYVADGSGKLAELSDEKAEQGFRWLKNYGGSTGKQRYYLYRDPKTGVCYAKAGYSADGEDHYTRGMGYVVRGSWTSGSRIYVATTKGRLLSLADGAKRGWRISKACGDGKQRYYLYLDRSGADKGAYYAVAGYSTDGYEHLTLDGGYVVTGVYRTGTTRGSRIYLADKNGKLASLESGKKYGWVTSSDWGYKNKRYLLIRDNKGDDEGIYYTTLGYSTRGYAHYTTKHGYVQTKRWTSKGRIFVVNSEGKMAKLKDAKGSEGWLVSDKYASSSRRYYLYKNTADDLYGGAFYAKAGYSTDGWKHVTTKKGYVATNKVVTDPVTEVEYITNANGLATKNTPKSIINAYLKWTIGIANDSRYGYSQPARWTGADDAYVEKHGAGDFDCSSMVIQALRYVGLKTAGATYTGDMIPNLSKHGWTVTRYNGKPSSLKRGDILLHPDYHVEFYLGIVDGHHMRVGAHGDEHNGIGYGARLGDQRQKGPIADGEYDFDGEISFRTHVGSSGNYDPWFTYVLRYTG